MGVVSIGLIHIYKFDILYIILKSLRNRISKLITAVYKVYRQDKTRQLVLARLLERLLDGLDLQRSGSVCVRTKSLLL